MAMTSGRVKAVAWRSTEPCKSSKKIEKQNWAKHLGGKTLSWQPRMNLDSQVLVAKDGFRERVYKNGEVWGIHYLPNGSLNSTGRTSLLAMVMTSMLSPKLGLYVM